MTEYGIEDSVREQVARWVDTAISVLDESTLSPLLKVDDINLVEALRAEIYKNVLYAAVGKKTSVANNNRKPGSVRQRLIKRSREYIQRIKALRQSSSPDGVSILFWPEQPTHMAVQAPVAEHLLEQNVSFHFVTTQLPIFEMLQARNMPALFAPLPLKNKLSGQRTRTQLTLGMLENVLRQTPMQNLADVDFCKVLYDSFINSFPSLHEGIAIEKNILNQLEPQIVVIGSDLLPGGRALSFLAKKHGIETVSLMHGAVVDPLHAYHIVDKLLVYGEHYRQKFIELGYAPQNIEVTGCPSLDSWPKQTGKIDARLEIADTSPYVLTAVSGPGNSISLPHHLETIENVMRASVHHPDISFIAKLHRKDKQAYYQEIAAKVPDSRLAVFDSHSKGVPSNITDWLQGCKIVLTGASTVALEAMVLEVPVITMDFAGELELVDFIEYGATIHVRSYNELLQAIDRILRNDSGLADTQKRARQFVQEAFGQLDGKAAIRCANVILDLKASRA